MDNIRILIVKHGKDDYSLAMEGDDVTLNTLSHMYNHRAGNHSSSTFQGITLENMLDLARGIMVGAWKEVVTSRQASDKE